MLTLNEGQLILESPNHLLRSVFLGSLIQPLLQLIIFSFEHLKDGFFILKLVLQSLSHILELFYVLLHLDKKRFLLLFLLFLHRILLIFLLRHVLLEVVQKGRELAL